MESKNTYLFLSSLLGYGAWVWSWRCRARVGVFRPTFYLKLMHHPFPFLIFPMALHISYSFLIVDFTDGDDDGFQLGKMDTVGCIQFPMVTLWFGSLFWSWSYVVHFQPISHKKFVLIQIRRLFKSWISNDTFVRTFVFLLSLWEA